MLYIELEPSIMYSSGELITFLDSDDWWEKDYLSSREIFFSNSDFDFFYSNTNFFMRKKISIKFIKIIIYQMEIFLTI